MKKVAKTLAGVHTHTHTHTDSLEKTKNINVNKDSYRPMKIGFYSYLFCV